MNGVVRVRYVAFSFDDNAENAKEINELIEKLKSKNLIGISNVQSR